MTTGEYLLSKSPLASGSALQHLLAMQSGGSGKTIFCSQITAVIDHEDVVVVRKPVKPAMQPAEVKPQTKINTAQKAAFSFKPNATSVFSFTSSNEIVVLRQKSPALTVMKMDQAVVTNKHPSL